MGINIHQLPEKCYFAYIACMCKIIVATKAVWKIQNTFLETEMVDVIKCAETCSLILNEL